MKKLVMAMAIALAAVAAQAEEIVSLNISHVYRAGTKNGISANGYLIYSDTLSQSAAVAAFDSAGASSYESTIASSAALASTGYIDDNFWGGNADVSRISEMYVLCFDQGNNYMYVSPVATPEGGFGMFKMFTIDASDTSKVAAMSASSFNGAGWYTQSVPEPTSGLLMLLGVAGLALKRKRA